MFKIDPPLSTDDFAAFDYFLSILFVGSRAPYNLYGQERGDRIWQYLKNTFYAEQQYGNYAIESLELYLDVWTLYSEKKLNPFHGVASALLSKLGYNEKDTDILLGTMLSDILSLSPTWWKTFSKKNDLTNSDIPVDQTDFMIFAKSADQGQNQINEYDFNGLTILMRAVQIGDVDFVKRLLSKGADPLENDGESGKTSAVDLALRKLSSAKTDEEIERYNLILNLFKDHCEKK